MSRDILSINLERLARHDNHLLQRIKIIQDQNPAFCTLNDKKKEKVEQIAFDSTSITQTSCVILYGLGNPYLLHKIIESTSENTFILVIDPSLLLFRSILSTSDLTFALKSNRIKFSIEEQPRVAVQHNIEHFFGMVSQQDYVVIKNPQSVSSNPAYFQKIDHAINNLKENAARNNATLKQFSRKWQKNVMENLPFLVSCHGIKKIFNVFQGKPAVIVSAGPSLDKNIKWLTFLEKKTIIIAVDSAYRSLLAHRITPDFLVCLDSQPDNYLHLEGVQSSTQNTVLVMNPVTYPKIPDTHRGAIVNMTYNIPLINWLEEVIGFPGETLVGGSVSTSAFDFAKKIGCSPLILIGQDLSYEANRPYAMDCQLSKKQIEFITKVKTYSFLHAQNIQSKRDRDTTNIFGGIVGTNAKMLSWKEWLESMCNSTRHINSTEGGVDLEGYESLPLHISSFLHCDDIFLKKEHINKCLAGETQIDKNAVVQKLEGYRAVLQSVISICLIAEEKISNAIDKLPSDSREDKNMTHSLKELQALSQEVLNLDHFININHWEINLLLEEVNAKQSAGDVKNNIEVQSKKNVLIFQHLFLQVREIAEQGINNVDTGLASLKKSLKTTQKAKYLTKHND